MKVKVSLLNSQSGLDSNLQPITTLILSHRLSLPGSTPIRLSLLKLDPPPGGGTIIIHQEQHQEQEQQNLTSYFGCTVKKI